MEVYHVRHNKLPYNDTRHPAAGTRGTKNKNREDTMNTKPITTLKEHLHNLYAQAQAYTTGQYTVVSLIMTVVLIIIYTQMYPIMKDYIDDVTGDMTSLDAAVISVIPFFVLLVIMLNMLWYVMPRQR